MSTAGLFLSAVALAVTPGTSAAEVAAASRTGTADVAASATPSEAILRDLVAETASAQVRRPDPAWHPDQRDCAGLVRFAYRRAYQRLQPTRLRDGLWLDGEGRALHFADAETLLRHSFAALGRERGALRQVKSGDLLAFRQEGNGAEPDFHLMLVVGEGASARVVYHPGEKGAPVRTGGLHALLVEPPLEWRPVPENSAFLGFFRFKEWSR